VFFRTTLVVTEPIILAIPFTLDFVIIISSNVFATSFKSLLLRSSAFLASYESNSSYFSFQVSFFSGALLFIYNVIHKTTPPISVYTNKGSNNCAKIKTACFASYLNEIGCLFLYLNQM